VFQNHCLSEGVAGFLGNTCRCSTAHAQSTACLYWEVMNSFLLLYGSLSTDISLNRSPFPSPDRPCVCVCVDHECW